MLNETLLILFLLGALLIFYFLLSPPNPRDPKLVQLDTQARTLLKELKIQPSLPEFTLYETHNYAYTEGNRDIYLCLRRPDGAYYDDQTLHLILYHELAHILSGVGDDHEVPFESWNRSLQEKGRQLGFLPSSGPLRINSLYPCYH